MADSIQQPSNNPLANPLAQPIKRPLPPPPPLTSKESVEVPKVANPNNPVAAPAQFAVPTDDEVRQEEQREKVAATIPLKEEVRPPVLAPKPAPQPAPIPPVPAPAPAPAPKPALTPQPAPTVLRPTEQIPTTQLKPPMPPMPAPAPTSVPPAPAPMPVLAPAPAPQPVQQKVPTIPQPAPGQQDEMLDLGGEAASPRRRWVLPLIIVAMLVFVGGVMWGLQSSGTIYIPALASVAGGVPKDPARALTVMQSALTTAGSYSYESSVAVTFGSALPDITDTSNTTASAEATGTVNGQVTPDGSSSTFDFTLGADYPVVNLKGKTVVSGSTTNVYIDTLGLLQSNNTWRKLTSQEMTNHALSWPLVAGDLYKVLTDAGSGTFKGTTVLQDTAKTPVAVYEYELTGLLTPADADLQQARLVVWVAKRTGKIQVAKVDGMIDTSLGTVVVQQQLALSNFGQAEVAALPADASPVSTTYADLYKAFGIGGVQTSDLPSGTTVTPGTPTGVVASSTNDAKRLADLTTVKAALEQYKSDFGLFPLSKERSKSSDANFVLKGSLVPKYIAAIPTDPAGGASYYGYTSDGFSFTLTSVLDDKNSPGAIAGNGYYYQEVKNN